VPHVLSILQGAGPFISLLIGGIMFLVRRRVFEGWRSKVIIITERDGALVQVAQLEARLAAAELRAADSSRDASIQRSIAEGLEDQLRAAKKDAP